MATKVVNNQERFDWVEYPVQDDVRVEVYWRSDRGGHGPAASLYFYDDEVLRFDCFGGDEGALSHESEPDPRATVVLPGRQCERKH